MVLRRKHRSDRSGAGPTPHAGPFAPGWEVPARFNFTRDVVEALAEQDALRKAMTFIDREGIVDRRTFGDVAGDAARWAHLLRTRVDRGDRVLVLLGKVPAWHGAMLGALKGGLVAVPCSEMLRARDLAFRVRHSGARLVVADRSCEAEVEEMRNQVEGTVAVLYLDEARDELLRYVPRAPSEDTTAGETALLLYTSGTTKDPKGAVHTHAYTWAKRVQAQHWLDAREQDVVWCTAGTGWAKSIWNVLLGPWSHGAEVVLHEGAFDPEERLALIQRLGVTVLCQAPTEYRLLAKLDTLAASHLPSLRHVVSAGEPLNPEVVERFQDALGLTIHDGYGQTENSLLVANAPGVTVRPGSMGLPTPGHDVAVIDEEGHVCPPGIEGDIALIGRPPTLFSGYWDAPEETDAVFRDGWYMTGDRATRDEDGYLWFVGRSDDVILSAAYRIGPFEVESALVEHPAVAESAVVGVPHPERGQVVKAFVVLREGHEGGPALAAELQEHVKAVTAPYKYPRAIEFVSSLPKTASGKIRRAELRGLPDQGVTTDANVIRLPDRAPRDEEAEARARADAEAAARLEAETEARALAEARARSEAEEAARREAAVRAHAEAEERARIEADELARLEAEAARSAAEERARVEADEQARAQAEAAARREAEERERREAEERARAEAETRARVEAEEQARAEAEAQREAEEQARLEAEAQARAEAEERARAEAEERARAEAEAEERARAEAEAEARREAEERARLEAEAQARAEAEERARAEAEAEAQREAEEQARLEAEAQARAEAEERARAEAEERARAEAKERARAEAKERARAEAAAQHEAAERARAESEEHARLEAEAAARREAREHAIAVAAAAAQLEAEERARGEAADAAQASQAADVDDDEADATASPGWREARRAAKEQKAAEKQRAEDEKQRRREEAERAKRDAEAERRRAKDEAEAAKQREKEEAEQRKRDEIAAREESARREAEEKQAAKQRAEDEKRRQREQAEQAKRDAELAEQRARAEAEAAKRTAKEEAEQRKQDEAAAREEARRRDEAERTAAKRAKTAKAGGLGRLIGRAPEPEDDYEASDDDAPVEPIPDLVQRLARYSNAPLPATPAGEPSAEPTPENEPSAPAVRED